MASLPIPKIKANLQVYLGILTAFQEMSIEIVANVANECGRSSYAPSEMTY